MNLSDFYMSDSGNPADEEPIDTLEFVFDSKDGYFIISCVSKSTSLTYRFHYSVVRYWVNNLPASLALLITRVLPEELFERNDRDLRYLHHVCRVNFGSGFALRTFKVNMNSSIFSAEDSYIKGPLMDLFLALCNGQTEFYR